MRAEVSVINGISKIRFLSGNMLKLIACVAMMIDHIGFMIFPYDVNFRIIGRIAFPIFAFMIAEGARYTGNRLRYFLMIFIEGVLMQLVYVLALNDTQLSIFITFSISILMIYALDLVKVAFLGKRSPVLCILSVALFMAGVVATYLICKSFRVDYGFFGVMSPVLASLFMERGDYFPAAVRRLDSNLVHVCLMGVGLYVLALRGNSIQFYALLALPLLLLYSGKRGRLRMKYFFYLFYPLHLVAIAGVAYLLGML